MNGTLWEKEAQYVMAAGGQTTTRRLILSRLLCANTTFEPVSEKQPVNDKLRIEVIYTKRTWCLGPGGGGGSNADGDSGDGASGQMAGDKAGASGHCPLTARNDWLPGKREKFESTCVAFCTVCPTVVLVSLSGHSFSFSLTLSPLGLLKPVQTDRHIQADIMPQCPLNVDKFF